MSENPSDNKSPLWLPPGSIRAILALLLVGGGLFTVLATNDIPQCLLGLIGAVVGFYFGAKQS